MHWYKRLWFKFVLEVVITVLLWVVYYVVRHLLPKKYRVTDSTIKRWMKDFSTVATNLAARDDSVGEVMKKSHHMFDYFNDKRSKNKNMDIEFSLFVRDLMVEVDTHRSSAFMNTLFPKLVPHGQQQIVGEVDSTNFIVKYTFTLSTEELPVEFYAVMTQPESGFSASYLSSFACTKGFQYQRLANVLFDVYDNRLLLTIKNNALHPERLEQEENQHDYILPVALYDSLLDEIARFKERNIQRSYIFCGAPGTGKTTLALELSRRVDGKVLKLDSRVFTDLSAGSTKVLIEGLECDFILVDDIDRINYSDVATFLYMLESLKSLKRKSTLLATVNDIKKLDAAVLRPGRIDDIIEFALPNQAERSVFMSKLLEAYGVNITKKELQSLAKETAGMSHAFLKEYCLQLQIEQSVVSVIAKIKKRKKFVDMSESTPNEDVERALLHDIKDSGSDDE